MKVKVKYAIVIIVNPEVSNNATKYIISGKNFKNLQKAANFVRRKMGVSNVAVVDYENHVCEYDITDEMIKKYVEGENNG